MSSSPSTALAALCARTLDNLKGENIVALDLRTIDSSPADYFIICSANSDTHARALNDALTRATVSVGERRPRSEGRDVGDWVLLDYFDVVVHIFRTEARDYYKLEKLWGDAPVLDLAKLEEKPKTSKVQAEKKTAKTASTKTAASSKTKSSKTKSDTGTTTSDVTKTSTAKASTAKSVSAKASTTKKVATKNTTKDADAEKPTSTTSAKKAKAATTPAKARANAKTGEESEKTAKPKAAKKVSKGEA